LTDRIGSSRPLELLGAATKPAGGNPGSSPPYGHDFHGARAKPPTTTRRKKKKKRRG
jgi:hypothetical protein